LEKFLDEFDQRFTDLMKADFEEIKKTYANRLKNKGYTDAYIKEHTLSVQDIVTLASIIQKETASDAESYDIASTFYNRLVANMQLGADATVYYAIGDYFWETLRGGTRSVFEAYVGNSDTVQLQDVEEITMELLIEYLDGYEIVRSRSAVITFAP
jgi:hypothetical protein